MASALNLPSTLALAGVSFLGGFSRLTSGRYTPRWYAFQLARAPNTPGTALRWLIPALDLALGALLLSRRARTLRGSSRHSLAWACGCGLLRGRDGRRMRRCLGWRRWCCGRVERCERA
ncbi:hypothetical protein GGX14DRAFT_393364 [Mycena pura]|uniref:Uncharacterized protein n=1 Tax=Mycena pura TaxID=153505 RepID=A0AAD6YDD8_9AGAR|nr:hypothetical protein GGX14DRAFT_393364 [Mycena pura]